MRAPHLHRSIPSWSRRLVAALALPVLGAVGLVATGVPSGAAAAPAYVALGDSYASGPLIPSASGTPSGCLRSDHDYPHLVAAALGLRLTDVSCVSATTAALAGPESTSSGVNPPQLGAIGPGTAVVTLTLGGDDLGFAKIIENCVALTPWGPTRVGRTCESHYDAGGVDQLAGKIRALGPALATVLTDIRTAAPRAVVFVTGYPDIVPAGAGCWPSLPFTRTDAPYLRQTEIELNQQIATQAAAAHATYVDLFTPSEAHNACTGESARWVEPIVPASRALSMHPGAAGEVAIAGLLEQAMRPAGFGAAVRL